MRHRHLSYPTGTHVSDLGPAAIDDLLDRGDLASWQPLARDIARDPWGKAADTVLRLCDAHPMYGTSSLWRTWIARRRTAARASTQPPARSALADARLRAGLTQQQVAARLGISQADVSKLERRSDVRVSTLQAYARAIGATLEVSLRWPESGEITPIKPGREP